MPLKVEKNRKQRANIIKTKRTTRKCVFERWLHEATVYQQLELRNYTKTTTDKLQPNSNNNNLKQQKQNKSSYV